MKMNVILMENGGNGDGERGGWEKEEEEQLRRPEGDRKVRGSRAGRCTEEEEGASPGVVVDELASYRSL